jgi:hypothetical protein
MPTSSPSSSSLSSPSLFSSSSFSVGLHLRTFGCVDGVAYNDWDDSR